MKRLIFLTVEDYNPFDKKLKPDELEKAKAKVLAASIKAFKEGIKENKSIKLVQELPGLPQVIVEFLEDQYHPVHDTLRAIEVVEIIDANLPLDPAKKKKQESAIEDDYSAKLKEKMAKFKK
jgi:hypothetical protein